MTGLNILEKSLINQWILFRETRLLSSTRNDSLLNVISL